MEKITTEISSPLKLRQLILCKTCIHTEEKENRKETLSEKDNFVGVNRIREKSRGRNTER